MFLSLQRFPLVKTTRERRKAARPGEIIEAAFQEFVKHGFSATRLDDVAARAGVTKGTIYVYFDSKEALFVAMITEMSREHFDHLAREIEAIDCVGLEFIKPFLKLFCDKLSTDDRTREVFRLLIAEAPRFPGLVDQHYEQFILPLTSRLQSWLKAGQTSGALRASNVARFPELILGPTMALQIWMLLFANRKPIDIPAYFDALLDFTLDGLRPIATSRDPH
jgi:AcrR family transcriptional regulator